MPNEHNLQNVNSITERLNGAKSIVLVDYKGINVEEVSILRKKMRDTDVDFFVAKNRLIKIALNNLGIKALDDKLAGPTAVAISKSDEVTPARELKRFINETMKDKDFPSFKVGYIDGVLFDSPGLIHLAELPSKEELIAKVLSGLNSPIAGFIFTLKGIIDSFVFTLQGISEKQ